MTKHRSPSIAARLRWYFFAVVLALTAVAATVTVVLVRDANETDAITDAEAAALAAAESGRIQISEQIGGGGTPDIAAVRAVVEMLRGSLGIQDAQLYRIGERGGVPIFPGNANPVERGRRPDGIRLRDIDLSALRSGEVSSFRAGTKIVAAAPIIFSQAEVAQLRLGGDVMVVVAVRELGTAGLGSAGPALLVGVLASLAVAVLLAEVLARRIRRPLEAVAATTHAISAGDLAARVDLPSGADRELTEVAATVDAMASRLDDARRDRQRFLIDVSHELRTPLTSISGYGELLGDDALNGPGEVADAGKIITRETARLGRLIDDLLTQARLETGEMEVAIEAVDLGGVAASVAAAHRLGGQRIGVEIVTDAKPTVVDGDEVRLEQVVGNLIDNAIGFAATRVEIAVEPEGRQAVLTVADDGPGLGSLASSIFERSFTTGRSRDRQGNLGIGLSVVAGLVSAMGGTIEAGDGEVGARFVVTMPLSGGQDYDSGPGQAVVSPK